MLCYWTSLQEDHDESFEPIYSNGLEKILVDARKEFACVFMKNPILILLFQTLFSLHFNDTNKLFPLQTVLRPTPLWQIGITLRANSEIGSYRGSRKWSSLPRAPIWTLLIFHFGPKHKRKSTKNNAKQSQS